VQLIEKKGELSLKAIAKSSFNSVKQKERKKNKQTEKNLTRVSPIVESNRKEQPHRTRRGYHAHNHYGRTVEYVIIWPTSIQWTDGWRNIQIGCNSRRTWHSLDTSRATTAAEFNCCSDFRPPSTILKIKNKKSRKRKYFGKGEKRKKKFEI
jgi:hypothetical protein